MQKLTLLERLHYYHRFWRYANRTEPDTVWFIRKLVRPTDWTVDIGANKGIVSWFLSRAAGPRGRVLAIEPQPELIPVLEKLKASFGLTNLQVLQLGLGDATGEFQLFREYAGSTGNMIGGNNTHMRDCITVAVDRLDDVLAERGYEKVDFIKCDVDGFEEQILRGATQTLERFRPLLLVEIFAALLPAVSQIIQRSGYTRGYFQSGGKLYPARLTDDLPYRHPKATFRNFLFVHDEDSRAHQLEACFGGKL